jgi:hypothetical protein
MRDCGKVSLSMSKSGRRASPQESRRSRCSRTTHHSRFFAVKAANTYAKIDVPLGAVKYFELPLLLPALSGLEII